MRRLKPIPWWQWTYCLALSMLLMFFIPRLWASAIGSLLIVLISGVRAIREKRCA